MRSYIRLAAAAPGFLCTCLWCVDDDDDGGGGGVHMYSAVTPCCYCSMLGALDRV